MTRFQESARISRDGPATGRLPSRLVDWLIAVDPAYSRLRLASRAILSLALSAGALGLSAHFFPLPFVAYGLAFALSFTGAMAVRDPGWWGKLLTRAFIGAAAVASSVLAGWLAPQPLIAYPVFLVVIFVSVYCRKFGARWVAVGMIAFLAYFMGDFLRPLPSDAGWVAYAAAITLAISHFVTTVLLPDDPERDFRRALGTIDRRINLILGQLLRAAEAGGFPDSSDREMRRHIIRLRETVLMAEGFIPLTGDKAWHAQGRAAELATALFDLQLAVERLVRYRHSALPPATAIASLLANGARTREHRSGGAEPVEAADFATQLVGYVRRARSQIELSLGEAPSPAFAERASAPPIAERKPDDNESSFGVPLSLQRPIQITLACGVALGIGLLLSSTRWYWAMITAFTVFNNTKTRADTTVRALHRTSGTLAGVIAGTLLATALHGNLLWSGVIVVPVFFLAFYFVRASYGVMIFFLTIALALLYGVMGMFSPQLLELRLTETLVGGAAGVAAAFLVFPSITSRDVEKNLGAFFDALGDVVAAARGQRAEDPRDLLALSRVLDRRYEDLAASVRPLGGSWVIVTRFGAIREKLLLLMGCTHWARVLSQSLQGAAGIPEIARSALDARADAIAAKIADAHIKAAKLFNSTHAPDLSQPVAKRPAADASAGHDDVLVALEALGDLIDRVMLYAEEQSVPQRSPTVSH